MDGVIHHLVQHLKRGEGPLVDRPEAVEHLSGPHQHPLATLFGQSNEVGHHAHRKVIRQLGRGVEAAPRDQLLHHALGLRGDLLPDRPQCPGGQGAPEHIPQRVVVGSVAAQGVAAQHLVHPVVHHHSVARREGLPVLQRAAHRVIPGEGESRIWAATPPDRRRASSGSPATDRAMPRRCMDHDPTAERHRSHHSRLARSCRRPGGRPACMREHLLEVP